MTLARLRRLVGLAGVSLGLAVAWACNLNPQPLPPGETAEGGKSNAGIDAGTGQLGGEDSGTFVGADATPGAEPDAGSDAVAAAPDDGGEADAPEGGGEADAPLDGPADGGEAGAVDAPSDGEEGGG